MNLLVTTISDLIVMYFEHKFMLVAIEERIGALLTAKRSPVSSLTHSLVE